jgi:hypothetical protein
MRSCCKQKCLLRKNLDRAWAQMDMVARRWTQQMLSTGLTWVEDRQGILVGYIQAGVPESVVFGGSRFERSCLFYDVSERDLKGHFHSIHEKKSATISCTITKEA